MLLSDLDRLINDPLTVLPGLLLTLGVALLTAITVHEFSHAFSAYLLGDTTAQRLGRLSLNPRVHLDPAGTVMLLLVGFGWGKPTPVNPGRLRYGLQGTMLVSLAGPLSNLATASVLALVFRLGWLPLPFTLVAAPDLFSQGLPDILGAVILFTIYINVVLMVFNLLPVAPLDGFKVALGLLPQEAARSFARLEPYGPIILMGVIFLDIAFRQGILRNILLPPINFLVTLILGV